MYSNTHAHVCANRTVETRLAVKLFEDERGNLPYKQILPMITKGPNSEEADKESQDLVLPHVSSFTTKSCMHLLTFKCRNPATGVPHPGVLLQREGPARAGLCTWQLHALVCVCVVDW